MLAQEDGTGMGFFRSLILVLSVSGLCSAAIPQGNQALPSGDDPYFEPVPLAPEPSHAARDSHEPGPRHDSHASASAHDPHPAHHFHHNHLALFVGATIHGSHVYPSLGFDYEFLFNEKVGVTALLEMVFADHEERIAGLGIAVHPFSAWKVAAIPAIVVADGHAAFLMRGTLEYGFHLGPVGLAPSVSVDYAHSEILFVPGVAVGMGF
jgi:hypothetical protein